jgi:HK97 family phage prohead protease
MGRRYRKCKCGSDKLPGLSPPERPRIAHYIPRPEYRSMAAELRSPGSGECRMAGNRLTGHAAVYDTPSRFIGFVEVLERGCFDGPLCDGRNIVARFNHSPAYVLGSTDDGRLDVWTDDVGLAYSVDPVPGWLADMVRAGDVDGSSFAFNQLHPAAADRWGVSEAGTLVREIEVIGNLIDVAPVEDPAYLATSAEVRTLDGTRARRLLERRWAPA